MGQKASRDADEAPRAQEVPHAQDREEEAPKPRQSIRERCYQIQTNGATTWAAPEPPPPPPPRPVREIYARYLAVNPLRPLHLCLPTDMALAERRRITGLEEDPKPSISWLHVGLREQDYEQRGVVEVTRSTTLGALSQMSLWTQRSCPSFVNSAAASVTIDELGDYSDPETGLEHHLEGCPTDEEKMAMRVAVFRGLHLIFALLERAELHRIIMEELEEERARFASLPQRVARAKSAKPAAKASKKTKKHSSRC